MLSPTEENYIKAIFKLTFESDRDLVGTNEVAALLDVKPATANSMLKKLREKTKKTSALNKKAKYLKDNIHQTIDQLEEDSVEAGHFYVQVLDFLREITRSIHFIAKTAHTHVDNNHKGLLPEQVEELNQLNTRIAELYSEILASIKDHKYTDIDTITLKQTELLALVEQVNKKQIKRIKNQVAGTKNSLMYLGILGEIKNILFYTINLLKSQRDFILQQDSDNIED